MLVSTVAVLAMDPDDARTVTVMFTVALPPFGIVPRVAVTIPPPKAQDPWLAAQETWAVPEGSGSVTLTASASAGPELETTMV